MDDQYPNRLYVLRQEMNSQRNADGDWILSEPAWEEISVCREEVNGKGYKTKTVDGKLFEFSSVVYMPAGILEIHPGTHIRIMSSEYDVIRKDAEVINFESGQFNCKAWL